VVVGGGLFRPIALVRGRAVAVWSLRGREIELRPFGRLAPADAAALRADGDEVVRYLHDTSAPDPGSRQGIRGRTER
jgi:hypothetical protein